ncbi:MAG: AAA family ATPase [Anaerolineales bacterium]
MTKRSQIKKDASGSGPETSAEKELHSAEMQSSNDIKDYTPTPEEAKAFFNKYLQVLPADARAKLERVNQSIITEALSNDNPAPGLEGLLPTLKTMDAAKILETEYPPIPFIIPGFLPSGLMFLIGKPKVGKSWLAMQLALSVMTGGKMFNCDVEKGRVLYLALEDNERKLQTRMRKQNWKASAGGVEFMFSDTFREQITALNAGGGKRLLRYIEKQKYRVVIVDTFSRSIQGDQLDPAEMTEAVGPLQQYALNKGIALIIIDHMPKNMGEFVDPISSIYGSVAKAGVTDTVWAIYKEQGKAGAKLAINGRDLEEHLLQLTFDTRGFCWHCEGDATDVMLTETRKAIIAALEDLGKSQAAAIADATGQQLNHVRGRLHDLANEGLVLRTRAGQKVFFELMKFAARKRESIESTESSTSEDR